MLTCDCGAEPGEQCADDCIHWELSEPDMFAQVLAEDGAA